MGYYPSTARRLLRGLGVLLGFMDRVWGALGYRADAAALPGPTAGGLVRRRDGGSMFNAITGLGGAFDKGAATRPATSVRGFSNRELLMLGASNGMARRILTVLPAKATRKGWSVPEVPELEQENERLSAWVRVGESMALANQYGGCLAVMVTEDDIPPGFRTPGSEWQWLQQPLDPERVGRVVNLPVFDAWEAAPRAWDNDIRSPTFREPSHWEIHAAGWRGIVHSSRALWFRGAKVAPSQLRGGFIRNSGMPDLSMIQAIWNELARLESVHAGGAVLAQELRESVLKMGDLEAMLAGDEADAFEERMAIIGRFKSLHNMILIDGDDDYQNRSNPPTGWKELSEGAMAMLGTVLGWPRCLLTGEAPGGLSTDDKSGLERERQLVSDYQESHRHLLRWFYQVLLASQDGPTHGQVPEDWTLAFAPLDEPDAKVQAEIGLIVAQMDQISVREGFYTAADVTKHRHGSNGYTAEPLANVTPIDPEEEDEREIQREARLLSLVRGGSGPAEEEPRADAADGGGCCIVVPAVDPGLASAVERAIGQRIEPETEPHVTVLYLGDTLEGEALLEAVAVVADEAVHTHPRAVGAATVRAFQHGPHGTPIVLELGDAYSLEDLNGRLLRRLAHLVSARQYRRYRPHLALGYAPEPLSTEAQAALAQIDASSVVVPVASLEVWNGDQVAAAITVGAEPRPDSGNRDPAVAAK